MEIEDLLFAEPDAMTLLDIEASEAVSNSAPVSPGDPQVLPREILVRIFSKLAVGDRYAVSKCCKFWRSAVSDLDLWKKAVTETVMPDPSLDPKDQFARIFIFASGLISARIKFSKEPASDTTPVATFQFGNLRHVVITVGIGAEVALAETLAQYCPNLQMLSFQFMQFLDLMVMGYLHKLKNLKSLAIVDSFIEDNDQLMSVLGQNFPDLELLEVPYMRDKGLLHELGPKLGKSLLALYFSAHRMDGSAFRNEESFGLLYPNLLALGISYPGHIPVRKLIGSLQKFKNLVVLKLTSCPNSDLVASILNHATFPSLQLLTVSSFMFSNNFGEHINLPKLKHLALESESIRTQFSDSGLQLVSNGTPSVLFLRLEYFRGITAKSIESMKTKAIFPCLEKLFLASLVFVKNQVVEDFARVRSEVEVVKEDNGMLTFQHPPHAKDPYLYSRFFKESLVNPSLKRVKEMQLTEFQDQYKNLCEFNIMLESTQLELFY